MDVSGSAELIEANTTIDQLDSGISGSFGRTYRELYAALSSSAQTRIDDFIADVATFISNQEPLSG